MPPRERANAGKGTMAARYSEHVRGNMCYYFTSMFLLTPMIFFTEQQAYATALLLCLLLLLIVGFRLRRTLYGFGLALSARLPTWLIASLTGRRGQLDHPAVLAATKGDRGSGGYNLSSLTTRRVAWFLGAAVAVLSLLRVTTAMEVDSEDYVSMADAAAEHRQQQQSIVQAAFTVGVVGVVAVAEAAVGAASGAIEGFIQAVVPADDRSSEIVLPYDGLATGADDQDLDQIAADRINIEVPTIFDGDPDGSMCAAELDTRVAAIASPSSTVSENTEWWELSDYAESDSPFSFRGIGEVAVAASGAAVTSNSVLLPSPESIISMSTVENLETTSFTVQLKEKAPFVDGTIELTVPCWENTLTLSLAEQYSELSSRGDEILDAIFNHGVVPLPKSLAKESPIASPAVNSALAAVARQILLSDVIPIADAIKTYVETYRAILRSMANARHDLEIEIPDYDLTYGSTKTRIIAIIYEKLAVFGFEAAVKEGTASYAPTGAEGSKRCKQNDGAQSRLTQFVTGRRFSDMTHRDVNELMVSSAALARNKFGVTKTMGSGTVELLTFEEFTLVRDLMPNKPLFDFMAVSLAGSDYATSVLQISPEKIKTLTARFNAEFFDHLRDARTGAMEIVGSKIIGTTGEGVKYAERSVVNTYVGLVEAGGLLQSASHVIRAENQAMIKQDPNLARYLREAAKIQAWNEGGPEWKGEGGVAPSADITLRTSHQNALKKAAKTKVDGEDDKGKTGAIEKIRQLTNLMLVAAESPIRDLSWSVVQRLLPTVGVRFCTARADLTNPSIRQHWCRVPIKNNGDLIRYYPSEWNVVGSDQRRVLKPYSNKDALKKSSVSVGNFNSAFVTELIAAGADEAATHASCSMSEALTNDHSYGDFLGSVGPHSYYKVHTTRPESFAIRHEECSKDGSKDGWCPYDPVNGLPGYTKEDFELAAKHDDFKNSRGDVVCYVSRDSPETPSRVYQGLSDLCLTAPEYQLEDGSVRPCMQVLVDNAEISENSVFVSVGFALMHRIDILCVNSNAAGQSKYQIGEQLNGVIGPPLGGRPIHMGGLSKPSAQSKETISKVMHEVVLPQVIDRIDGLTWKGRTGDGLVHGHTQKSLRDAIAAAGAVGAAAGGDGSDIVPDPAKYVWDHKAVAAFRKLGKKDRLKYTGPESEWFRLIDRIMSAKGAHRVVTTGQGKVFGKQIRESYYIIANLNNPDYQLIGYDRLRISPSLQQTMKLFSNSWFSPIRDPTSLGVTDMHGNLVKSPSYMRLGPQISYIRKLVREKPNFDLGEVFGVGHPQLAFDAFLLEKHKTAGTIGQRIRELMDAKNLNNNNSPRMVAFRNKWVETTMSQWGAVDYALREGFVTQDEAVVRAKAEQVQLETGVTAAVSEYLRIHKWPVNSARKQHIYILNPSMQNVLSTKPKKTGANENGVLGVMTAKAASGLRSAELVQRVYEHADLVPIRDELVASLDDADGGAAGAVAPVAAAAAGAAADAAGVGAGAGAAAPLECAGGDTRALCAVLNAVSKVRRRSERTRSKPKGPRLFTKSDGDESD